MNPQHRPTSSGWAGSDIRKQLGEARELFRNPPEQARRDYVVWAVQALLLFGTAEEKQNVERVLNSPDSALRMNRSELLSIKGIVNAARRTARQILKHEKYSTIDDILWAREFLQHFGK
jgi:hypothetical protein